jgi:hypothetical protein
LLAADQNVETKPARKKTRNNQDEALREFINAGVLLFKQRVNC